MNSPQPQRDSMLQNRVFVGGISWKADEASLAEFFSSFGNVVESKIIMDKQTGKSKGYGFVTFEDAESAQRVKQASSLYFMGKMMNVGEAVRKSETGKQPSTRRSAVPQPAPSVYQGTVYYPSMPISPEGYTQPYYIPYYPPYASLPEAVPPGWAYIPQANPYGRPYGYNMPPNGQLESPSLSEDGSVITSDDSSSQTISQSPL